MNTYHTERRRRWPLALAAAAMIVTTLAMPGFAPASIEEQRKRLPPPAEDCDDPVTGLWFAQHKPNAYWVTYSLDVRRVSPGSEALTGNIESHAWLGGEEDVKPPPCDHPGASEYYVDQPSDGTYADGAITFGADEAIPGRVVCGSYGGYWPDRFSGKIDPETSEFHSVRKDGHNADTVVVLRRIRCGADASKPIPPTPTPPPPTPVATGCSCF